MRTPSRHTTATGTPFVDLAHRAKHCVDGESLSSWHVRPPRHPTTDIFTGPPLGGHLISKIVTVTGSYPRHFLPDAIDGGTKRYILALNHVSRSSCPTSSPSRGDSTARAPLRKNLGWTENGRGPAQGQRARARSPPRAPRAQPESPRPCHAANRAKAAQPAQAMALPQSASGAAR